MLSLFYEVRHATIGAVILDCQYLDGIVTRIFYAMLFVDHCAMTLHVQKIKSSKLCYVCGVNRKQPFATLKNHECPCECRQCARTLKSCYYCRPVLGSPCIAVWILYSLHPGVPSGLTILTCRNKFPPRSQLFWISKWTNLFSTKYSLYWKI